MTTHLPIGPEDPRDATWLNDILGAVDGMTLDEGAFAAGGVDRFRLADRMATLEGNSFTITANLTATTWTTLDTLGSISSDEGDLVAVYACFQMSDNSYNAGAPVGERVDFRLRQSGAAVSGREYPLQALTRDQSPAQLLEAWFNPGGTTDDYALQYKSVAGTATIANLALVAVRHRRAQ